MSKRKNRLASDPMDSPAAQDHAPEPGVVAIDAPSISMGPLDRFVASDEIEKIELVPSVAVYRLIDGKLQDPESPAPPAPPRWRLQIAEQVEDLGLVLQSVDLDRGASIRASTCAISCADLRHTPCVGFVARGAGERADAAIAQALETLRWLVEPA